MKFLYKYKVLLVICVIISMSIKIVFIYFHWYFKRSNSERVINQTYEWEVSNKSVLKIVHFPFLMALLTLFRIGIFGAAQRYEEGGTKRLLKASLPKIFCHLYPTMMKLGTSIPYLKKIEKTFHHVKHLVISADISILSPKINKFCYISKYKYRFFG